MSVLLLVVWIVSALLVLAGLVGLFLPAPAGELRRILRALTSHMQGPVFVMWEERSAVEVLTEELTRLPPA